MLQSTATGRAAPADPLLLQLVEPLRALTPVLLAPVFPSLIHFPAPLRSPGVTRLLERLRLPAEGLSFHRYYGCSDFCAPAHRHAVAHRSLRFMCLAVSIVPSPTTPTVSCIALIRYPCSVQVFPSHLRRQVWASPLTSRLAEPYRPNRVHLDALVSTRVTDRSFTSCCSPPRLAATQLQSVTGRRAHA